MEVKLQHEEKKQLLKRTDYTVRVFHEGATQSRGAITKALAKQLKAKKELLVVRRIRQAFGESAAIVEASVYDDEGALKEFESAHITERHAKVDEAEKKAAEEAKAAAEAKKAEEAADEKASEEPAAAKEGDA